METKPPKYELDPDGKWFHCRACSRTSYHLQDVAQLYCGRCKQFYPPEREEAA